MLDVGKRYPDGTVAVGSLDLAVAAGEVAVLARALAADPPVLLMEEPFGAVDPVARGRLQEEFLTLQRRIAKTVVFVTHDVDEAVRLGDRIAVLSQGGRLEQFASPGRVLGAPATQFVAEFVGSDRALRRLAVTPIEVAQLDRPPRPAGWPAVQLSDSLRVALATLLANDADGVLVLDGGDYRGVLTLPSLHSALRRSIEADGVS